MTDALVESQTASPNGASLSAAEKIGNDAAGPSNAINENGKDEGSEQHDNDTTRLAKWQWLFSPSDMLVTPSVLHSAMSTEQERHKRWKGVRLIFQIGDYMRLGNHVTCTAVTFFHRFYMRKAMPASDATNDLPHDTYTFQEMAPTCIYLACKVEEAHRKLHGIVEATMAVLDRTPTGIERAEAHVYRADVNSRDYRRWKDIVLLHEERLLETLCFDMIVDQPHPLAIKACQRMSTSRDMAQLTIVVLNSLLYGSVCTFGDASTLAACAFKKACQYLDIEPNSWLTNTKYADRHWTDAFDVDADEVDEAMPAVDEHLAFHHDRVAPTNSAAQSSVTTPLPAQHVGVAHLPMTSSSDEPGPDSSTVVQNKISGHAGEDTDSPKISAEASINEDGARRPVSRHGSRMGVSGPPPPLASATEEALSAADQHDQSHEEAIIAKVNHEQEQQEMAVDQTAADVEVAAPAAAASVSDEEGAL